MWFPSFRSLIFGHTLPRNEARKQVFLKKVIDHFEFNKSYPLIEVDHTIRSAHVVNVRLFRDALFDYGYLEKDLYVEGRYRRVK